eukprot:Skav208283  [mRNA]  locus=scaffold897:1743:12563:+ [translate_table: standard]
MADLKPSETAALRQQLHEQSEELHILESQQNAEEAQEAQLRRDVKKLRQDLSKSDSRRRELLTTVAHGVSELSEEIMAGHLRTKSEVDFAEKKLADVKNEFETKTAELRALTKRMDEARLYTETESKDILRRSKEEVQRTRVESRQKEEELQKELMELQQRSSQLGQSNGVQQAEQNARAQARQEQHRQRRDSLRAELQAARERAANLALKCEQTWQSLTAEKRRAAQIAEIRGPHASHAQSSQPYTALTEGKLYTQDFRIKPVGDHLINHSMAEAKKDAKRGNVDPVRSLQLIPQGSIDTRSVEANWERPSDQAPLNPAALLASGAAVLAFVAGCLRRSRSPRSLQRAAPEERFSPAVKESSSKERLSSAKNRKTKLGLDVAFDVAHSMGHLSSGGTIGTDHLLVGMASVADTSVSRALQSVGVTAEGLQEKLSTSRDNWVLRDFQAVTTADIATAIEETVGLRPGSVSAAEARGIVDLEEALHKRVRGQRAAVRMVSSAVARAKAGLQEEHRPIASLLLYGPPGTTGF